MTSVHGSGKVITEPRELPAFHAIRVQGAVELRATIGESQSVVLTADDNIVPIIETTVHNGRLTICTKPEHEWDSATHLPTVTVTVAGLTEIDASGATTVTASGLTGDTFSLDVSGASNVTAAGEVSTLKVEASGAVTARLGGLSVRTADVHVSGASNVEVQVADALTGDASGASNVRYSGSPAVSLKTSGVAGVSRR